MDFKRGLGLCAGIMFAAALSACQVAEQYERSFTVLYTNDEHGWMEGMGESNSAANLMQLWKDAEGYSIANAEDFLLLSGGDNWTGPAISTWNQGESMVELMNSMGYAASAIGNHEFDFGLDTIRKRSAEADYAYVSANTTWRDSGLVPKDIGIVEYRIVEAGGVLVGVIGLTTTETSTPTNPATVAPLRVNNSEATLRRIVPEIEAQGVELTFVISHVCLDELEPLALAVADLDIALFGAGHCNELIAKRLDSAVILGGGFHFGSYARATFSLAADGGVHVDFATAENAGASADPETLAIIEKWQSRSEASLSEVLAYVDKTVPRGAVLDQLVVDSWLWADPVADVAVTNAGGIRAPLPSGAVTLGDTVAILPFDNTIVAVEISGAELVAALNEGSRPRAAGIAQVDDKWVLSATGEAPEADKRYRVLINSFMYAGGDGYERFASADPNAYDTGTQYGLPFRDWLRSLASTQARPLRLID